MELLDQLAALIEARRTAKARYLVGIDGPDAAGKTTLVAQLSTRLAPTVVTASIDDFHRRRALRHAMESDLALSSYRDTFDNQVFREALALAFKNGAASIRLGSLDYATDAAVNSRAEVPPRSVLLVDGVFLQRPELRDLWDLVVYLDVSPELSKQRGVPRDIVQGREYDELIEAYDHRYLPGQVLYRAECDPLSRADIVIDNADLDAPRVVRWPENHK